MADGGEGDGGGGEGRGEGMGGCEGTGGGGDGGLGEGGRKGEVGGGVPAWQDMHMFEPPKLRVITAYKQSSHARFDGDVTCVPCASSVFAILRLRILLLKEHKLPRLRTVRCATNTRSP